MQTPAQERPHGGAGAPDAAPGPGARPGPGRWLAIAAAVAIADQASKLVVVSQLRPGESHVVTGFFNLVLAYNRGAAFSFLADASGWQRYGFIAVAIAAIGFIAWLLFRHGAERLFCTGLALIMGGALGNLYDRVTLGHVVDFLDLHAAGWHWPAFNLADSAITVGAALLVYDSLRDRKGGAPGRSG